MRYSQIDSLYWQGARHLSQRKLIVVCFGIITIYVLVAILGILALLPDYQTRISTGYEAPSWEIAKLLGTDLFGRSVLYKILCNQTGTIQN